MYKKICITNRKLVKSDFLAQIARVAESDCSAIILREKDLTESEYTSLAKQVLSICGDTPCVLHSFITVAMQLNHPFLHVTMDQLRSITPEIKKRFSVLGVSVHSLEEALAAQALGATYVTASHIFPTDCKKGLAPRGLAFLREICDALEIPVYALGGIQQDNIAQCIEAGADGVCMMSAYMRQEECLCL